MVRRRASMGVGLLGAALAASVGAYGCTDDAVALSVVCAAVGEAEEGVCKVATDLEQCVSGGQWNLAFGAGYRLSLLLQSGLAERESEVPLRAETNALNVTDMVITLRNPAGQKLPIDSWPNPFTIKTAGYVPPGGLGVASATVIPAVYIKRLTEFYKDENPLYQILVDIEVRAVTQGQEEVMVASWQYPVDLLIASFDLADKACIVPPEDDIVCDDSRFFLCDCSITPCEEE